MMPLRVDDFSSILRDAISEARKIGLEDSAAKLESRAFAAFTTSSEMLGESGAAIREFLAENEQIPGPIRQKLDLCMNEIRKVWPKI